MRIIPSQTATVATEKSLRLDRGLFLCCREMAVPLRWKRHFTQGKELDQSGRQPHGSAGWIQELTSPAADSFSCQPNVAAETFLASIR